MWNLLGAIGLTLETDKSNYKVGDIPTYRLIGAVPGSTIAWTSYKNGQSTGEYNATYGQIVDANGTAELTGSAWLTGDIGSWQKELLVIAPDGSLSNAVTSFSVSPAVTTTPGGNAPTGSDFFSGNVSLPLIGNVSKPVAILGGIGLFFLLSKRGR